MGLNISYLINKLLGVQIKGSDVTIPTQIKGSDVNLPVQLTGSNVADDQALPVKQTTSLPAGTNVIGKVELSEKEQLIRTKATGEIIENERLAARAGYLKEQTLIGNGDPGHLWKKYGTTGTLGTSTAFKEDGVSSIKLTSVNAGFVGAAMEGNFDFSSNDIHFRLWAYSPDISKIDRFRFLFYCPDSNNTYSCISDRRLFKSLEKRAGGPCEISQSKGNMQVFGSPNWANCKTIVVDLVSIAGQTAEVYFDNVYSQKTNVSKGKVILRFDDGFSSAYNTVFPVTKNNGVPASIVVFPTTVGTPGKMTLDQLKEMHTWGWDISSHTWSHADFTNRTRHQSYADLKAAQNWLIANGFVRGSRINVFGGHKLNEGALQASRALFQLDGSGIHSHETLPWGDPYLIRWLSGDLMTAAQLTAYVDTCAQNKGLAAITFHDIVPGGAQYTTDPTELTNFITALAARTDVDVITYSDLLDNSWISRA